MAGNQQFCLRWNNHQSTLISVFDNLLESGTLVDCTLAAEGQYLKAHKVVLSACSPFFEGVFSQHYEKHPIIILKDVTFTELKAMLDYMYRGEVNISQEQLGTFLKAAESLQIKGLTDSGNGEIRKERKIPPLFPQGLIVEQRAPRVNNNDSPPPPLSLSPKRRKRKSSEEKEEILITDQAQSVLPPGPDGFVKTEFKSEGKGSESGGETVDFEDDEEMDLSKPGTSANSHNPGSWNASTESPSDDAYTLPGGSQEQAHTCTKCWREFSRADNLKRHQKMNCGKEPLLQCPFCGHRSRRTDNMRCHVLKKHEDSKLLVRLHYCTCGRGYRHPHNLERHKRYECGKMAEHFCMFCPYRSKHKHNLQRHILLRHSSNTSIPHRNLSNSSIPDFSLFKI